MRQGAIDSWVQFSRTGSLFQKDAASRHRAGAGTCDANNKSQIEVVSVVILRSVAHILCPSDAAGRTEVAERVYGFDSSDAAKTTSSVDPAWRV